MVQFLSINFFSWISSIFVGVFQKFPFFLCHSVYGVRYYPRFQVTAVGLGTYYTRGYGGPPVRCMNDCRCVAWCTEKKDADTPLYGISVLHSFPKNQ